MQAQRLAHDAADGHPRVERAGGVLEHDRDRAPVGPHRAARQMADVGAGEAHDPGRWLEQSHDQAAHCRLARAALADECDDLSRVDAQRDPVDRAHRAEVLDEVLDLADRRAVTRGRALRSGWLPYAHCSCSCRLLHACRMPAGRFVRARRGECERGCLIAAPVPAAEQRSANVQASGCSASVGTRPGISRSRWSPPATMRAAGTAPSRPTV